MTSSGDGLVVEEINSVLLVLLCTKLGISNKEIEEAIVLYMSEQTKMMAALMKLERLDREGGGYNA